jgi:hypothetical protein
MKARGSNDGTSEPSSILERRMRRQSQREEATEEQPRAEQPNKAEWRDM